MSYGYPGSNSQLENHKVTEESFWPSFSDIMMVIVMVFLLVTVAVILNNWALISKLTNSVEAQKAASSLADNRKVENQTLEKKLSSVEQNLLALNTQFDKEKAALEKTQENLSSASQALTQKEQSLASIENKLNALNAKYEAEQLRLSNTNQQLSASEQKLSSTDKELIDIKQQLANKVTIIASLDKKLLESTELIKSTQASLDESKLTIEKTKTGFENETKHLIEEQNKLSIANKSITQLQASITDLEKTKKALSQVNQNNKSELEDNSKTLAEVNIMLEKAKTKVTDLETAGNESSNEIIKLKKTIEGNKQAAIALQTDRNMMDVRLRELLSTLKLSEKKLSESRKNTTDKENELLKKIAFLEKESLMKTKVFEASKSSEDKLKKQLAEKNTEVTTLQNTIAETQETAKAIEATVTKSENSLKSFEDLLTTAEKQIAEKNKTIQALTVAQEAGDSQLLSLQGEYDSLDTKYQKLLRPARSSKGKYVASVSYKKVGSKRVIRFKSNPKGSYKTVTNKQLAKSLEDLKKKHKKDLYVKVVIPKNSGLSYNEAWRFTINLQRKYDYYYND